VASRTCREPIAGIGETAREAVEDEAVEDIDEEGTGREAAVMEIIIFLVFLGAAASSLFWTTSRSQDLLQRWASQNGYRIIEAKYAYFFKGPFFWTSSKGQTVYRVIVEDEAGLTRSGWVRCGSWAFGVLSDQVQARWDDEAPMR
jgi:hypothetical protein